jgi:putative membrane protein
MADHMAQSVPGLDVSTTLAFERTRVAYERTMLGWVRTATSLITFGFTIYKYFQIERGEASQTTASSGRASLR